MPFRAFIAVEAGELPDAVALLRDAAEIPADLKVVAPENLHVTLAFLGNLEETRAPEVAGAIETAVAGEAPFRVRLRGLGTFPPRGAPRVLWIAMDGADALGRIAARLAERLRALALPAEDRPFRPHLTLARARTPRGADEVRRFVEAHRERDAGAIDVRDVRLMESRLSPSGPTYRPVAVVPLGGGAS